MQPIEEEKFQDDESLKNSFYEEAKEANVP